MLTVGGGRFTFKNRRSGFTLLELIVVLIVVGLVSALTIPQLTKSLTRLSLKATAKKISALLRTARNQAVSESRTLTAVFDIDKQTVEVFSSAADDESNGQGGLNMPSRGRGPVLRYRYDLFPEIKIGRIACGNSIMDAGRCAVSFYSNGSCEGAQVELINREGKNCFLILDLVTGSVVIKL